MTKRRVLVLAAVALALIVLGVSRTWVSGTVKDAVLQNTDVSVGGGAAAPAVVACALVGAAGIVAALTTGRIAKRIAAVIAAIAGLIALVATITVISGPAGALRERAVTLTGHTGSTDVSAHLTPWPWVTLVGAVLLAVSGLLAFVGTARWSGLSASYDAPSGGRRKTVSDWDRLSQGEDPTDADGGGLTE